MCSNWQPHFFHVDVWGALALHGDSWLMSVPGVPGEVVDFRGEDKKKNSLCLVCIRAKPLCTPTLRKPLPSKHLTLEPKTGTHSFCRSISLCE